MTRALVSVAMLADTVKAREMVDCETPSARATSSAVTCALPRRFRVKSVIRLRVPACQKSNLL
jgi:hypothetical protein